MTIPPLGSRVALQCARRAHNDHDPTQSDIELIEVPPTRWTLAGIEFEDQVAGYLLDLLGSSCADLRRLPHREAMEETHEAMAQGIPVILGGALPDDLTGDRRGRPDLLVSWGEGATGSAAYLPADIKSHSVIKEAKRGSIDLTPLSQLAHTPSADNQSGLTPNTAYRANDLMQLAHYWRMLEACGRAATMDPIAGLIGSDTFTTPEPFIVWQSLTDPVFTTFSRSRGTAKRSALERYDHEFDFRLKVIEVAQQQGEPDAPEPLVRPIIVEECDSCPWHDVCLADVGELEPSRHISSGRLSLREWNALRAIGIVTLQDLAALDLADPRLDDYWGEIAVPEKRARAKLADAIVRAQMTMSDQMLRPLGGAVDTIPRADVEVDFDLEWDSDGRIYLWGMLISDQTEERSDSLYSWAPLDDTAEDALAASAIARLTELRDQAAAQGKSFLVYHYSHPEISMVRNLIQRGGSSLPSEAWWEEFTGDHFVDLLAYVKQRFIGRQGLGLKVVAREAGFDWDGDDANGEASMDWIDESRSDDPTAREEARARLLRYNEDDVAATLAVRRWLE